MHQLAGILTRGEQRQDAHDRAVEYADALLEGDTFDYHLAECYSPTFRLTSQLGQRAVEGALRATRRDFETALNAARLMLRDFTDEQIYRDEYGAEPREYWASRHQFTLVGQGEPYLYADYEAWDGPIRSDRDYENVNAAPENVWSR